MQNPQKPILVLLILSKSALERVDATHIYCFLVQTIPLINHSTRKEVSPNILNTLFLFQHISRGLKSVHLTVNGLLLANYDSLPLT